MLEERLREAIDRARRHPRRVAVVVVDLDGFKGVDDERALGRSKAKNALRG